MTKPAGSTVGIREGSWTRKNGRRSKAAPVGQWPTGAVVLVCCLPGHIFLTEPHEHHRRLGAGGLALGSEDGAVAGTVDDSGAHGPLHGRDGILTEIGHIRIGQDIGVLTDGHIIALLLDIVWFKPYGKSMILFIRTFHQPGGSVLCA